MAKSIPVLSSAYLDGDKNATKVRGDFQSVLDLRSFCLDLFCWRTIMCLVMINKR